MISQEFLKKQPAKGGVKPQSQAAGGAQGPSQGGKKAQSSERGVKMISGVPFIQPSWLSWVSGLTPVPEGGMALIQCQIWF